MMAEAYQKGITPAEFRKIAMRDLDAISQVLGARRAKGEQQAAVQQAMRQLQHGRTLW